MSTCSPSQLLVRIYLYDPDSCCFPESGAKVLSVSVASPLVSNRGRNTLSARGGVSEGWMVDSVVEASIAPPGVRLQYWPQTG